MMEQEAIYLHPFYHSECGTAKRLLALMNASNNGKNPKFDLKAIEKETGIEYDEVQIAAIRQAVDSKVMVLTGGPGTGKTTTINMIIRYFVMNYARWV